MAPLRERLGLAIRRLRKRAGYSQESFADAVGLHRTYMGSVERGERNVSLDNIERIATALDLSTARLLLEAEKESAAEEATPGHRSRRRAVGAKRR